MKKSLLERGDKNSRNGKIIQKLGFRIPGKKIIFSKSWNPKKKVEIFSSFGVLTAADFLAVQQIRKFVGHREILKKSKDKNFYKPVLNINGTFTYHVILTFLSI